MNENQKPTTDAYRDGWDRIFRRRGFEPSAIPGPGGSVDLFRHLTRKADARSGNYDRIDWSKPK